MKIIHTKKAPKAVGSYSQAIKTGNLLFCSGQIALDPKSMKLIKGDSQEQTFQIIKNLSKILRKANLNISDVVKTTIFLTDIGDFTDVNDIYGEYFSHKPARSTVEVSKLPLGANVEIEVIAEFR